MKQIIPAILVAMLSIGTFAGAIEPIQFYGDTSLEVFILVEEDYQVGDKVDVEVHTLSEGEHVDVDNITMTLDQDREVALSKTGTGIYKATITIDDEEVEIKVEVYYNGEYKSEYAYLSDELTVFVEVSDITPEPGDTVYITVYVKYHGEYVDADLDLEVVDYEGDFHEYLDYDKVSTGIYRAEYNIDDTDDETLFIGAYAYYNGKEGTGFSFILVLFYEIWYHEISVTSTQAKFEIWVSDMNGRGVSGADINLDYEYETSNWNYESGSLHETTDSEGKASFTISYTDVYSDIELDCTVQKSGKSKEFKFYIDTYYDEFDVVEKDGEPFDFYREGEQVTKSYIAYNGNDRLSDQTIYYYVYSESHFIESGEVTTDENGKFTIEFTVPQGMGGKEIEIRFESLIDDYYQTESDHLIVCEESVYIQVGKLRLGGKTRISVTAPTSSEFLMGIAYWMPVDDSSEDWRNIGVFSIPYLIYRDGKLQGEFIIPEFMPDTEYLIMVTVYDFENEKTYSNYLTLRPGESVGESSEGSAVENSILGISMSYFIVFLIIILIISVLILLGRKREVTQQYYQYPAEQPYYYQAEPGGIQEFQQVQHQPFYQLNPSLTRCPNCGEIIQVYITQRPFPIQCPRCGIIGAIR